MSWPYSNKNPEATLLTALKAAATTAAATLSPAPAVRTWRDQSVQAIYPAYLVHVMPADWESENNIPAGPLHVLRGTVACQTHTDEQPPSTGTTPVAGDTDATLARSMLAAVRAQLLGTGITITGATILRTESTTSDTSDGPINHLSLTLTYTLQLAAA